MKPCTVRVNATRKELLDQGHRSGPGSRDELERIFGRSTGSADGRGGAGLGLAIARGFAEANGGRLWASRAPDRARRSPWHCRRSRRRSRPAYEREPQS